MKTIVLLILSFVWLSGVFAPPLMTLMSDDTNRISLTMNEEESQEEGKEDIGEEVILSPINQYLISYTQNKNTGLFVDGVFPAISFSSTIPLPPPERSL